VPRLSLSRWWPTRRTGREQVLKAADGEESLMSEQAKDSEPAGYKRPPKSGQFKKGRSGNPGGRPKRSGSIDIDFDQHLDEVFDVKVNGRRQKMSAKEIELNRVLMKAMDKNKPDFKSIAYLLDLFEKYDCISRPVLSGGGVLEMPTNQYPFAHVHAHSRAVWPTRDMDQGADRVGTKAVRSHQNRSRAT